MLEGLDAVDWGRLSHAYGAAVDVPDLIRALATRASNGLEAAVNLEARLHSIHSPHHVHHFFAQELPHGEDHLLLLIHQLYNRRVFPVQALAAGRHRVADVLTRLA